LWQSDGLDPIGPIEFCISAYYSKIVSFIGLCNPRILPVDLLLLLDDHLYARFFIHHHAHLAVILMFALSQP
jgi:hypothetical protein